MNLVDNIKKFACLRGECSYFTISPTGDYWFAVCHKLNTIGLSEFFNIWLKFDLEQLSLRIGVINSDLILCHTSKDVAIVLWEDHLDHRVAHWIHEHVWIADVRPVSLYWVQRSFRGQSIQGLLTIVEGADRSTKHICFFLEKKSLLVHFWYVSILASDVDIAKEWIDLGNASLKDFADWAIPSESTCFQNYFQNFTCSCARINEFIIFINCEASHKNFLKVLELNVITLKSAGWPVKHLEFDSVIVTCDEFQWFFMVELDICCFSVNLIWDGLGSLRLSL